MTAMTANDQTDWETEESVDGFEINSREGCCSKGPRRGREQGRKCAGDSLEFGERFFMKEVKERKPRRWQNKPREIVRFEESAAAPASMSYAVDGTPAKRARGTELHDVWKYVDKFGQTASCPRCTDASLRASGKHAHSDGCCNRFKKLLMKEKSAQEEQCSVPLRQSRCKHRQNRE